MSSSAVNKNVLGLREPVSNRCIRSGSKIGLSWPSRIVLQLAVWYGESQSIVLQENWQEKDTCTAVFFLPV